MSVQQGTRIGPFEIVSRIGAGGMGEVFRARDSRLGRDVAIKVLPSAVASKPDRLRRFEQEARSLASLNHPNILVIHESGIHEGQPFLVSELLEGKSLRELVRAGAIPHRKAVGYAQQVVAGLIAAHAKGIVHRDLKPENLFLTDGAWIKILDFGLAKLKSEPGHQEDSSAPLPAPSPMAGEGRSTADGAGHDATTEGLVLGTLGYMSPEQLRGEAVDPRSDLFSFGLVLFEMLTGSKAFQRPSAAEVMAAILREEPPELMAVNPQLPRGLDLIVHRCLEKAPANRFQSARDLAFALESQAEVRSIERSAREKLVDEILGEFEGVGKDPRAAQPTRASAAPLVPPQKSVAVLPFVNMSSDRDNEHLSDGITEDLITALSRIQGLRVPARTSSFAFKGKQLDVREIGEKLRVGSLVEGSLRKAGTRLRVTAQLIDVSNGFNLWSEKYDREMADVFAIQDDITRSIVSALQVQLTGNSDTKLVKAPTQSLEAYELYLKGREFWNQRGVGLMKALHYFELALLQDPNYALAHSGLADAYGLLGFYGYRSPAEFGPRMRHSVQRALELAPELAEAHVSFAWMKACLDWDFEVAESAFQRALKLNPNYCLAPLWHAGNLCCLGRLDEAVAQGERAVELDPHSPYANTISAWYLLFAHRPGAAVDRLHHALELDPNFSVAYWLLGHSLVAQGEFTPGIAALEKAAQLTARAASVQGFLAHAYATAGRREEALATLGELLDPARQLHVRSFFGAIVYAGLGEDERALEWLEKAYQEHDIWMIWLKQIYPFDRLHGHPKFQEIAEKIGPGKSHGA